MKRPELVEVEWLDATGDDAWEEHAKIRRVTPARCFTVGHLMARDDTAIIVAGSWNADHANYTLIPMGTVVAVRPLAYRNERKG